MKNKYSNRKELIKLFMAVTGALVTLTLLQSCCDCEDCVIKQTEPACNVKNNALIEFKAGVVDTTVKASNGSDSSYYKPVADYATETFEFPADNSSSGSQPSDERFKTRPLAVSSESYYSLIAGAQVTAVIYDTYPPNSEILGDILVSGVTINSDPLNSTAKLRFYGSVTRYSTDFMSENSGEFCEEFLPDNTDIAALRDNASLYGAALKDDKGNGLSVQVSKGSYQKSDITVIDADGRKISDNYPDDVGNRVLYNANTKGMIDITVSPGQVYYVKARNGREFAMHITGISQGVFPNDPVKKKRVYIMFAPI